MYRSLACLAVSLTLYGGMAEGAAVFDVNWGTGVFVSVTDIDAENLRDNESFDANGGPGAPVSMALVDDSVTVDAYGEGPHNRGIARALADLQLGTDLVPVSRALAILTGEVSGRPEVDGAVAAAGSFASKAYRYIGIEAATLHLTFTLDGLLHDPGGTTLDSAETYIDAQVAVFADENYALLDSYSSLILTGATPKADDLFSLYLDDDTSGQTQTLSTTLIFDVTPGEVFHVWQSLDVQAQRSNRVADAYGTLTGTFAQPGLVAAIPEPSALALLGLGGSVLALHALRRRRERA